MVDTINKEREKLGLPPIDTSGPGFHPINENISQQINEQEEDVYGRTDEGSAV